MIQDITFAVENHFSTNWHHSQVNYEQSQFTPHGSEWVEVIVIPIASENVSIESCTNDTYELHTLVYGSNKVKAGLLADKVIAFLQNTNIDKLRVRTWGTIANGYLETNDTYFYKLFFDCNA